MSWSALFAVMNMPTVRDPKPGQRIGLSFSEDDVRDGTILQYEEVPIEGSCDLTTEYMMVDIPGKGAVCLTRHSIKPEVDQEWNVEDSTDMVTVLWDLE